MKFPLLIINLKLYKEGLNPAIPHIIKDVSKETGVEIVLCPSHTLLKEYSKILPVFSQSLDPLKEGAYTGHMIAEYVKHAGAIGALLNHSEKKMQLKDVKLAVERCKAFNLLSCVCADDNEVKQIANMDPDMILAEPPELVGGNISVSVARPDVIKNAVMVAKDISPKIKVLCGAGIKNGNDVKKAIELGADGVGVGSGIVKAPDMEKALRDIVSGFL